MNSLQGVLSQRTQSEPSRHLIFYKLGDTTTPRLVSYKNLLAKAQQNSVILRSLQGFEEGRPILIHLEDHWDTILWFWSVLVANGLPVVSSPLTNSNEHRNKHLQQLSTLLQSPICITRANSLYLFESPHCLRIHTIESLSKTNAVNGHTFGMNCDAHISRDALAFLMLTSGSTGDAKAVRLTHAQVLAAVAGKASVRSLPIGQPFLNWIGLDHVASLVEIHLQALWLGVDQIHVHTADIVSSPKTFLDLVHRHRICRSFAPNFFLGRLVSSLQSVAALEAPWDLSCLTVLASGGETNDVKTCVMASALLEQWGAPRNAITPGFGMTETCAGAIFNLDCPDYDVSHGRSAASLGKCMEGIEMRISVSTREGSTKPASPEEPGELQVRGQVVTDGYYGNPEATSEAFTCDGWFRTGDSAMVDSTGSLYLIGRAKDVINVNGVKIASQDIQSLLEQELGGRVARLICFPSQAPDSEKITIAYTPHKWPITAADMADIEAFIIQTCMVSVGCRPLIFAIRQESLSMLPASALGKISRARMRSLFEAGLFSGDVKLHRVEVDRFQDTQQRRRVSIAPDQDEASVIEDMAMTLNIKPDTIGVDTTIFELGFASMDLIRLKHRIDTRLSITLPVVMVIKHPTARYLAAMLKCYSSPSPDQAMETAYDPVVTMEPGGNKTPLWLVHPGVGEVLVFVGLARHLKDRPIYALRARGFEPGQVAFGSISEAVETYVAAVRRRQPHGPYAVAGYSYGTMLAFEMAKKLDAEHGSGTVRFLGSLNLPPHIRERMLQLDWSVCLLHLTYFLGLTTEAYTNNVEQAEFRALSRGEALAKVLDVADAARLQELGLQEQGLALWTDVAYGLQRLAVDYEPQGVVDAIDVFHAEPLRVAAASRREWVDEHLSQWKHFCRTAPRFHAVGGAHYTMIGPDHVVGFASKLRAALRERGLD
ncbi:hypothetical protein HIM_08875 [Hirsutella minnesotensis 3608]|uniref:Carrier domain-containing protein n=1 Tax=Hirsutella minnesotensis 3608 TaxID=1043627 RepID=A0A0F7ZSP7_9HYPO|nr:hypothetical protein HIM_08875 [Hirsutella minnesotensis 3608]